MSETPRPPEAIGASIANLTPLALMTWAAVETGGPLRWSLIAWVAFVVALMALNAAGWNPAEAAKREAAR